MMLHEVIDHLRGESLKPTMILEAEDQYDYSVIILEKNYSVLHWQKMDGTSVFVVLMVVEKTPVWEEYKTIEMVVDHAMANCRGIECDGAMLQFAEEMKSSEDADISSWATKVVAEKRWTFRELERAFVLGFDP